MLQTWAQDAECAPAATFLDRLSGCRVFSTTADVGVRAAAARDLDMILSRALSDPRFREYVVQACGGAEANCTDNAQEIFNTLRVAAVDPGQRENATVEEVLAYHRKAFRLALLDRHVATEFSSGDKLEEALALKILLQDALALPVRYDGMNHASVTAVMGEPAAHAQRAEAYVRAQETVPGAFEAYLQADLFWQAFVSRQCAPAVEASNAVWVDAQEALEKKTTPFPDESRAGPRVQAARRSTWAQALQMAQGLPGLGMGHEFQALQEAAREHLMKELGEQLMHDPAPGGGARVAHGWLSRTPQWQAYQSEVAGAEQTGAERGTSPGMRMLNDSLDMSHPRSTPPVPRVFPDTGYVLSR